jgi:hypothetical protein
MDSWYACQKLMAMIDNLGKIYYCHLSKKFAVNVENTFNGSFNSNPGMNQPINA